MAPEADSLWPLTVPRTSTNGSPAGVQHRQVSLTDANANEPSSYSLAEVKKSPAAILATVILYIYICCSNFCTVAHAQTLSK